MPSKDSKHRPVMDLAQSTNRKGRDPMEDAANNTSMEDGHLGFGVKNQLSLAHQFTKGSGVKFDKAEIEGIVQTLKDYGIDLPSYDLPKHIIESTIDFEFESCAQYIAYLVCVYLDYKLNIQIPAYYNDRARLVYALGEIRIANDYRQNSVLKKIPQVVQFFDDLFDSNWRQVCKQGAPTFGYEYGRKAITYQEDIPPAKRIEFEAARMWIEKMLDRFPPLWNHIMRTDVRTYSITQFPGPWGVGEHLSLAPKWSTKVCWNVDTEYNRLLTEMVPQLRQKRMEMVRRVEADMERSRLAETERRIFLSHIWADGTPLGAFASRVLGPRYEELMRQYQNRNVIDNESQPKRRRLQ